MPGAHGLIAVIEVQMARAWEISGLGEHYA